MRGSSASHESRPVCSRENLLHSNRVFQPSEGRVLPYTMIIYEHLKFPEIVLKVDDRWVIQLTSCDP